MGSSNIIKNTFYLYIRMIFVLVVSLYTSRVVLRTLGIDDFGTYNVVAGFVSLFSFLNAMLSSSMQRYYNYEGAKNGVTGYKNVYSAGLIIHICISIIVLILLETIGLWYVNNIMVIPAGRMMAANIVYQASIFSLILVIAQIPYLGAIIAKEKMDYYAVVSIIDVILRLVVTIALPYLPYDKLIIYSILLLCISLFDFWGYYVYAKFKILRFRLSLRIDTSLCISLVKFSGWNLLGTVIFMLKGQGVNLLLNLFFGPVVNAARGIAAQVSSAVSGFSSNIMTAYRPQLVESFASGKYERTKEIMFSESKICFFLMLILSVPLILENNYILNIWLGNSFPEQTSIFTILVLIDALICILNTPCTHLVWAVGNIKYYQIATSIVNVLLLPLCYILLHFNLDAISVFIATIVVSVVNQIVSVVAANRIFAFGIKSYLKAVILPCVLASILLPILPVIIHYCVELPLMRFILVTFSSVFSAIILYFLIMNNKERQYIFNFIKTHLGK